MWCLNNVREHANFIWQCIDLIWQPSADRVSFWRQSNANIWGPFHLAQHQCCETPHHKLRKKVLSHAPFLGARLAYSLNARRTSLQQRGRRIQECEEDEDWASRGDAIRSSRWPSPPQRWLHLNSALQLQLLMLFKIQNWRWKRPLYSFGQERQCPWGWRCPKPLEKGSMFDSGLLSEILRMGGADGYAGLCWRNRCWWWWTLRQGGMES